MYFDVRGAKLLKPGEHMLVEGCNGLRLVASAQRRRWIYRYKDPYGRMKQLSLGTWPLMSVQDAVAQWMALVELRSSGLDPVTERKEASARAAASLEEVVVSQVVKSYIEGPLKEIRSKASFDAGKSLLLRALEDNPIFARKRAKELTRVEMFAVIESRKDKPASAQKLKRLLGAAWDHAKDRGVLSDEPNLWREILHGKLRSKGKIMGGKHIGRQQRVLSQDEVAQLLNWLPNMRSLGRDAVVMYLWTAARGAEIFSIKAESVSEDEEGRLWWTVPKEQTKNARFENAVDLRVPLFGRAREVIERRMQEETGPGFLFETSDGREYLQSAFSTYVYDLQPYSPKSRARPHRPVLPVTDWTPHDLRRTARTFLAKLGCPNEIGEAIVGHLPPVIIGTCNAYSYDAERLHWLGKLSDYLDGLAGLPARP